MIYNFQDKHPDSFKHLTDYFQVLIEDKKTSGLLAFVAKDNEIEYCMKFGFTNASEEKKLDYDNIFRIYSMTKPIACLAMLTLVDEGKISLDDPIEDYLPEFKNKNLFLGINKETSDVGLRKATSKITIKHLFTQTSGHSYGLYPMIPIDRYYGQELGYDFTNPISLISSFDSLFHTKEPKEVQKIWGHLPLAFEPETHWKYGFNHEILSLLVEKITGSSFIEFLRKRILKPLGMADTDYYVPDDKIDRLVDINSLDEHGKLISFKGDLFESAKKRPKVQPGGGGLYSTLKDYATFCHMMLDNGKLNGKQIVKEDVIKNMTKNHLSENKSLFKMLSLKPVNESIIQIMETFGYGLGVRVRIKQLTGYSRIGSYDWMGAANTIFWIDPQTNLFCILLSQNLPPTHNSIQPIDGFKVQKLVYKGLNLI